MSQLGRQGGASQPLLARVDTRVLALVEDLFRNAATRVRTRLVNRVGGEVPVRFGAATVSSLGEVFDRLHGHGAAIGQFSVAGREQAVRGVIVLEGELVHRMVGLMLGERQESKDLGALRNLTALDLRLASRVCEDILFSMAEASSTPEQPRVVLDSVTPTSRAIPSLPRSATVLESTLDFGAPDAPYGLASVLLPAQAEGLLWGPSSATATGRVGTSGKMGLQRVLPVPMTVVAELARVSLPLPQLKKLHVGSEIQLGRIREVQLRIGGRPTMMGEAGEMDGMRSVKVRRRLRTDGSGS